MRKKLPVTSFADSNSVKAIVYFLVFASMTFSTMESRGQIQLLKDINTRENPSHNEYRNIVNAGSLFYYIANNELWRSNGTIEGTFRLKAFREIKSLSVIGSSLYFAADNGSTGLEVWKTNGTVAGTVLVKDVYVGINGSAPSGFTNVNGVVYFSARSSAYGMELWKTNGTAAGTFMVKDIIKGTGSSNPGYLVNRNGILLFVANDGLIGYELWRSDGTAAGTVVVKDIRTAYKASSLPQYLTNVNGIVYFGAIDDTGGRELWKTDGTAAGTVRLKDIWPGTSGSGVKNLVNLNGTLVFTANDGVHGEELWRSNGTEASTLLVKDMNPGPNGSNNEYPGVDNPPPMGNFTIINGLLYFTAARGSSNYVYRTDGTTDGTISIVNIPWSDCCGGNLNPNPEFAYRDGYVYFYSYEPMYYEYDYDLALYKMPYNGTTPSLVMTFPYTEYNGDMMSFNNMLYTVNKPFQDRGYMLLQSDGTAEGTKEFIDNTKPSMGSVPNNFVQANGYMFFLTWESDYSSYYQEVWRTDGTTAGTIKLGTSGGGFPWLAIGNYVYFVSFNTVKKTWSLYKTSGTIASTVLVKEGDPALSYSDSPRQFFNISGRLYFTTANHQLWRSDGTATGTKMLKQFVEIENAYAGVGRAYVVAKESQYESSLYRADATGAYKVRQLHYRTASKRAAYYPSALMGSVLYFITQDDDHGNELWRTDGTAGGTYMVKDFSSEDYVDWGIEYGFNNMIVHNNVLYVTSTDDFRDMYLWKQTGPTTFEKVREVYDDVMLSHNGLLYIWGRDTRDWGGNVLEVTDGTAAGFKILAEYGGWEKDHEITKVGSILYFMPPGLSQLYRTDGSDCGTFLVNTGLNKVQHLGGYGTSLLFGGEQPGSGVEPFIYRNINSLVTSPCTATTTDAFASSTSDARIMTAYPNPYTDRFTLRVEGDENQTMNVAIYTNTGLPIETLQDLKVNTDYENIGTTWPKGIYIVKISKGDEVTTHMVVKK
jgi:ELWxxDGT repeat protein